MSTQETLVSRADWSVERLMGLSANLLPIEVVERRRMARVRGVTIAAVAMVVVLLLAGYGWAWRQTSVEQSKVDAAGTESLSLSQQRMAYNELLTAQTQTKIINTQLATLLATDVQWAPLFAAIRAAQPPGLVLTSLAVALTDQTASGAGTSTGVTTASGLPSKDGSVPIGSLTIGGTSADKSNIAGYVDAIGDLAGVGNTLLAGVTDSNGTGADGNGTDFTLRADLTKAALSHHYTRSGD